MKKLVLKTALITLAVAVVLAAGVVGILSLAAPGYMMRLTASLGLYEISGDFAYRQYERSGDLECLARSFLISAEHGDDREADSRFSRLYGDEGFSDYCEAQSIPTQEGIPAYSYRDYLCGQASVVKYRLASSEEEKAEVVRFAAAETASSFPEGNPLICLAVRARIQEDAYTCGALMNALEAGSFERTQDYQNIVKILSEVIHE